MLYQSNVHWHGGEAAASAAASVVVAVVAAVALAVEDHSSAAVEEDSAAVEEDSAAVEEDSAAVEEDSSAAVEAASAAVEEDSSAASTGGTTKHPAFFLIIFLQLLFPSVMFSEVVRQFQNLIHIDFVVGFVNCACFCYYTGTFYD
jgi:hypothetical protein